MCGLALPWYDYLYQQCYQFNYLISTGISMLAIYLVLFSTELKKCRQYIIAFFLVGTVAGGWHEGFGVPLLSDDEHKFIENMNSIDREIGRAHV